MKGDIQNYANRYQEISLHSDDIKLACPLGLSLCPLGMLYMAIGHVQHGRWAGGMAVGQVDMAVGHVAWPLGRWAWPLGRCAWPLGR